MLPRDEMMTFLDLEYATFLDREYARFVNALFVNRSEGPDGLTHAAIGIAGEAGEILDAVKKVWVYNQAINFENLIEELGDLEYYMQALRTKIGVTRAQCINANMVKLKKRYPNGYTDQHAAARLDKG